MDNSRTRTGWQLAGLGLTALGTTALLLFTPMPALLIPGVLGIALVMGLRGRVPAANTNSATPTDPDAGSQAAGGDPPSGFDGLTSSIAPVGSTDPSPSAVVEVAVAVASDGVGAALSDCNAAEVQLPATASALTVETAVKAPPGDVAAASSPPPSDAPTIVPAQIAAANAPATGGAAILARLRQQRTETVRAPPPPADSAAALSVADTLPAKAAAIPLVGENQGPDGAASTLVAAKLPLTVLYGSQTGTCQEIARNVAAEALQRGFAASVASLNEVGFAALSPERTPLLVIVSSSTGDGDPPDNAASFFTAMRRKPAPGAEPVSATPLTGVRYTVLGLGDSNYTRFMYVPRSVKARLAELGATEFYRCAEADEVEGIESVVDPWTEGLWAALGSIIAMTAEAPPPRVSNAGRRPVDMLAGAAAFAAKQPVTPRSQQPSNNVTPRPGGSLSGGGTSAVPPVAVEPPFPQQTPTRSLVTDMPPPIQQLAPPPVPAVSTPLKADALAQPAAADSALKVEDAAATAAAPATGGAAILAQFRKQRTDTAKSMAAPTDPPAVATPQAAATPAAAAAPQAKPPAAPAAPADEKPSVTVLYGSQTGTCQEIARNVAAEALAKGYAATVASLNELGFSALSAKATPLLVVVCSSTGDGDPPDNATSFFTAMRRKPAPGAEASPLSGVRYTLLGLGDSNYTRFMYVPRSLKSRLAELGATEFYRCAEADEVEGIESVVDPWTEGLWAALSSATGQVAPTPAAVAPEAPPPPAAPAEVEPQAPVEPAAAPEPPVAAKPPVTVLYGSRMGTCEEIARNVAAEALAKGYVASVASLNEHGFAALSAKATPLLVVICSSTGDGDPPDNAATFFADVSRTPGPGATATPLAGVRYTLLGLGDSNYRRFQNVPRTLKTRLAELGATVFYPCGEADEEPGIEKVVDPWTEGLWAALESAMGQTQLSVENVDGPAAEVPVAIADAAAVAAAAEARVAAEEAAAKATAAKDAAVAMLAEEAADKAALEEAADKAAAEEAAAQVAAEEEAAKLVEDFVAAEAASAAAEAAGEAEEPQAGTEEPTASEPKDEGTAADDGNAAPAAADDAAGTADPVEPEAASAVESPAEAAAAEAEQATVTAAEEPASAGDAAGPATADTAPDAPADASAPGDGDATDAAAEAAPPDAQSAAPDAGSAPADAEAAVPADAEPSAQDEEQAEPRTPPAAVQGADAQSPDPLLTPLASVKEAPGSAGARGSAVSSPADGATLRRVAETVKRAHDAAEAARRRRSMQAAPINVNFPKRDEQVVKRKDEKAYGMLMGLAPVGVDTKSAPALLPPRIKVVLEKDEGRAKAVREREAARPTREERHRLDPEGMYSAAQPFWAHVSDARYETAFWSDRKVLHLELSIRGSNMAYEPGDSIGVLPVNHPDLVANLCKRLKVSPDRVLSIQPKADGAGGAPASVASHLPSPASLGYLLSYCVDLTGVTRKSLLRLLAEHTRDAAEKRTLLFLSARGGKDAYAHEISEHQPSLLDLLVRFPSCHPPLDALLDGLQPLAPRMYSISSSRRDPGRGPNRLSVALSVVRFKTRYGTRLGVATTWLDRLAAPFCIEGCEPPSEPIWIPIFLRRAADFKPPSDLATPLIMIGPGTGVSPFRGFLQERRAAIAEQQPAPESLGEALLFYGCRREDEDYLYRADLEGFKADGTLSALHVAFSRAKADKVYVQDLVKEQGEKVWALLQAGAYVYVCGDGAGMAKDVHATLAGIAQQHGALSEADAAAYLQELSGSKRYVRDVWS